MKRTFLFLFVFLLAQTNILLAQEVLNLAGEWHFKLDPDNKGISEKWFKNPSDSAIIRLPGCLQEQGYGNIPSIDTKWWNGEDFHKWFTDRPWMAKYQDKSNFKLQEFLVPDRHYIGAAWYTLQVNIPKGWEQKDVELFLERCHWETRLWLDGEYIGQNRSLGTPHIYRLKNIKPGRHTLVLRVDNSEIVNIGGKPHSVSEQTAGTWNGIIGKLELRAQSAIHITNVQLYPDVNKKLVRVKGTIVTEQPDPNTQWLLDASVKDLNGDAQKLKILKVSGVLKSTENAFDFNFPMGDDVKLWDEFDANLYQINLMLKLGSESAETINVATQTFGMRSFGIAGKMFAINGQQTFLRGNVDCAVFPKTGYTPMDVNSWKRVWQTYKDFGLNMARFHSWCPPEAAFTAADEIGIYLAPEVGEWVTVNKQPQFDFLKEESLAILNRYGNHPSFVQLAEGNENGGDKEFFRQLIATWKTVDPRHLYSIKANSKSNPENIDYEVLRGTGNPFQRIRYQDGWPPLPLNSAFQSQVPGTSINWDEGVSKRDIPLIQHENAQFCAYPDVMNEISKYTGYLNPSYLEIAQDQLRERGMLNQVPDFVRVSGKWQIQLTKEEFEADYRTKGLAGFHWLCLADFTGQDTAPVGFTDAFYDTKPYVNPNMVKQWNAPTVLLASIPKRVFTSLSDFKADIMVSHFGKENINLSVTAQLKTDDGKVLRSWNMSQQKIAQGSAQMLGQIATPKLTVDQPTHLVLELKSASPQLTNSWDIWVFPDVKVKEIPKNITVAKQWNADVAEKLKKGGTVLLLPAQEDLKGKLPICFTNYYWTSFGENAGQSSAAGILIDTKYPVFKNFPTEDHVNWQWWDLLTYAHPIILDSYDSVNPFPKSYKAPIQPIDTWKINRKLALLSELKVGKGKLMICAIDLETDLDKRPVTKTFRNNLLNYIASKEFNPQTEVSISTIQELFNAKK
ncbi:hypothetical protein I5M32_13935 [Pedobacter sp. SD-b]|uniref:beta-galactosidase n=1 Tax=Pedobacter segetis TaxID=2793069 RepID=A0ABS1BME2_9SPHI|nr:sugar-binding domain-containing protein [Pedobacter segetis]MBK0384065.1 hypothetical protein [Pedobacter segetis]